MGHRKSLIDALGLRPAKTSVEWGLQPGRQVWSFSPPFSCLLRQVHLSLHRSPAWMPSLGYLTFGQVWTW
jgi:hypothetical protein